MNLDTYEDTDIDVDDNSDIEGFEITYSSINRKAIRKIKANKYHIRQKLDSINEKRSLDRQLDSFNKYWDF